MKRIFFIVFLMIHHFCFAQISNNDYNLQLTFGPSFINRCKLIIQNIKSKSTAKIIIDAPVTKTHSKSYFEDKVQLSDTVISQLTQFLRTYKFKIRNNIDTVDSSKEWNGKDSVMMYSISAGMDGINVDGNLEQNNVYHHFAFWSPKKGTENAKFMNVIFDILESAFSKDSGINYIEALRDYFPHGLIVRKILTKPIMYKLYGNSNEDQEEDLKKFLSALPKNKPIYIDVSQFSIAPIIDDDLAGNKNIYWVNPNKYMLRELQDAEISKRHIIYIP